MGFDMIATIENQYKLLSNISLQEIRERDPYEQCQMHHLGKLANFIEVEKNNRSYETQNDYAHHRIRWVRQRQRW
jgi:hypothetical protein